VELSSSSSSSLHGLGESPVTTSSIVVSPSIVLLVYLRFVFRVVDISLRAELILTKFDIHEFYLNLWILSNFS